MREDWKTYKLGEVAELATGFAFKSKFYENLGSIKVIRGKNVTEGYLRWGNDCRYWNHSLEKLEKYIIKEDDIVIGMDGSKIGKNRAIVRKHDLPSILAQRVARVRAKNDQASQKYIWQLINNGPFENYVENVKTGTSIPHISLGQINDFKIIFPPLAEQKQIASILSALDDKIELNLQMNKTLEEMAMALYKHWFVDFGPFQKGKFVDSELGLIPEGWEVKSIGDFVKVIGGFAFKGKDFTDTGDKVIKIKNISNNVVSIEGSNCIPNSVAGKTNPKFLIKPGSYLVAMTGAEVGKVGIVPDYHERLWLNQRVGMISEAKFELAEVLVGNFLQSIECFEIIQNLAYGSAQPNISSSGLEGIKMLFPRDISIIRSFLENLKYWDELKVDNYTENQTLTKLRDTLLPKLISGEVRVKEAKEMLSQAISK